MNVQMWNAITAALDERSMRLTKDRVRLLMDPASQDRDFALECNADAIRDTERAKIAVAREAGLWDDFVDHPADMRWDS